MRLIDADELLEDPYFQDDSIPERVLFIQAIEDTPTIDPACLVKRGRWGNYDTYLDGYRCSCCKLSNRSCTKYCPSCGAKMVD